MKVRVQYLDLHDIQTLAVIETNAQDYTSAIKQAKAEFESKLKEFNANEQRKNTAIFKVQE